MSQKKEVVRRVESTVEGYLPRRGELGMVLDRLRAVNLTSSSKWLADRENDHG